MYDPISSTMDIVYRAADFPGGADAAPLSGVDNIAFNDAGELFVAEDGGNMELVLITPDRVVTPFLRIVGQGGSELAGPAFDPSGSRLYVSSMRGPPASSPPTASPTRSPVRSTRPELCRSPPTRPPRPLLHRPRPSPPSVTVGNSAPGTSQLFRQPAVAERPGPR